MKRFLLKAAIFFLPVLMGLFIMELSLRSIPNNYKYKKQQLIKKEDSIKILVLGSSHAHYGINPDYFSFDGFNFSNVSQSLDLDYALLEKYGGKLKNLDYIIIPISYFSLFGSLSTGIEQWRIKNYYIYYGIMPYKYSFSINNIFEILNGTMTSNIKRIYSYYKDKPLQITVSCNGFGLNYSSKIKNNMEETGKTAALRHTVNDEKLYEYLEYNKGVMEKIIEWCKNKRIKLIFVTLPAYYTYRDKLNIDQLSTMTNYMNQIIKNYNNAYYYNFLDDDSFMEGDFFDADHLNEIGAMKITKKINNIITADDITLLYH